MNLSVIHLYVLLNGRGPFLMRLFSFNREALNQAKDLVQKMDQMFGSVITIYL